MKYLSILKNKIREINQDENLSLKFELDKFFYRITIPNSCKNLKKMFYLNWLILILE
jgi:hypothetical protein